MAALKRGILCLLAVGLFASARPATGAQQPPRRREAPVARYAYFELRGAIADAEPSLYLLERKRKTLLGLVRRIHKARADQRLEGIIVRVGPLLAGWAKVQEIRDALLYSRREGKEVICVLETSGSLSYYLATAADRIVLLPAAHVMLLGLRAEAIFARELLDKIGVEPQFVQVGQYKTAAEPLQRTEPTPRFRESISSVLDSYYGQLLDGIAEGRDVPVSRAAVLVREGPYTSAEAREAGLVDEVLFTDQFIAVLEERAGVRVELIRDYGQEEQAPLGRARSMNLLKLLMGREGRSPGVEGPAVAVVYAVGPIMAGNEEGILLGGEAVRADRFVKAIREAVEEDAVKAIVVRVDSPGGSALASDVIWRELKRADAEKPVIASLSDVAASGGYYVAAGSRQIYAEPGSLTGSIGVVGGKLVLSGLFRKIGLSTWSAEKGGRTSLPSAFEKWSPEDREAVQKLLQDVYDRFVRRVADRRGELSIEEVRRVARGRVWTGAQALENGLVDQMGGLPAAIEAAKKAAGLPPDQPVRVLQWPRPRSLMEVLLFGEDGDAVVAPRAGPAVLQLLDFDGRVRAYMDALMNMRTEMTLCILPALITVQ